MPLGNQWPKIHGNYSKLKSEPFLALATSAAAAVDIQQQQVA